MRVAWLFLAACQYQPADLIDAIDSPAPPFDALRDCPESYLLASGGSRYRIIATGARPWEHNDACRAETTGLSHLAAIDSADELAVLQSILDATSGVAGNKAWLGGVQPLGQANPAAGWLSVTGGPMIGTLWDGGEPNDGSGTEDNGENFIGIEGQRTGLVDFPSGDSYGAICECDGLPLETAAAAAIDANRR